MSITGFIANEDFWSPPPFPPYRIDFAKNRKKSESTQNGLKRQEIEKNKILKIFLSFFSGGGHQAAKKIFRFLAELGNSESILIFSDFLQNRSDRGGRGVGGTKNLRLR